MKDPLRPKRPYLSEAGFAELPGGPFESYRAALRSGPAASEETRPAVVGPNANTTNIVGDAMHPPAATVPEAEPDHGIAELADMLDAAGRRWFRIQGGMPNAKVLADCARTLRDFISGRATPTRAEADLGALAREIEISLHTADYAVSSSTTRRAEFIAGILRSHFRATVEKSDG